MKTLIKTMLALTLVACGTTGQNYSTDPEFSNFVTRFELETGVKVTVPIIFMSDERYAGVCKTYADGYRVIEIDYGYWKRADSFGKEQVLYHELGHCVLNRDHTDDVTPIDNGYWIIPNSIMFRQAFGQSWFYRQFREHYVQELMQPGKRL